MAKKLPAKGIGLSRLRVRITVCGPMTAAAMPPVSTQEMALGAERRAAGIGGGEAVLLGEGGGEADGQEPEREQRRRSRRAPHSRR